MAFVVCLIHVVIELYPLILTLLLSGVEDSPLMTWGEIDSTPARLETATPGPAFRFPEESERDRLTHKMVDANTKKHR